MTVFIFTFTYVCSILCLISLCNVTHVSCQCSPPWKKIANGRWYSFAEDRRGTFQEARSYCRSKGGYVVDISSDSEYYTLAIKLVDRKYSEGFYTQGIGSVWVSNETRPEQFSKKWRSRYADGEPNNSGSCLYLSSSRSLKWRDTSCLRTKGTLCESNEVMCHGGSKNDEGDAVKDVTLQQTTTMRNINTTKAKSVFDVIWGRSTTEKTPTTSEGGIINTDNLDQETGCSCTEYVNRYGYGRCQKKSASRGGRYTCYVRLPSNCTDLTDSVTYTGKKVSAEACDTKAPLPNNSSVMTCRTIENVECALPFKYQNKVYNGCTSDSDIDAKPWCSTNTDNLGRHRGEENWGYCKEEGCPLAKHKG